MSREPSTDDRLHPIGVVARRTGLAPNLIRAWERRYGAVEPLRDEKGVRLYAEEHITRLRLLKQAVDGGRTIGRVVTLDDATLAEFVAADARVEPGATEPGPPPAAAPERITAAEFVERCLASILRFDDQGLRAQLQEASVGLGTYAVLETVLAPVMAAIGERWRAGELRPAHEHLATVVVRAFIGSLPGNVRRDDWAPTVVVATPAGQHHELGAQMVVAMAATEGWHVLDLGVNLPAEELALAARSVGAHAISLSVTFPLDDPQLPVELARLREMVGPDLPLLVGGQGAQAYTDAISAAGAVALHRLSDLVDALHEARTRTAGPDPGA